MTDRQKLEITAFHFAIVAVCYIAAIGHLLPVSLIKTICGLTILSAIYATHKATKF